MLFNKYDLRTYGLPNIKSNNTITYFTGKLTGYYIQMDIQGGNRYGKVKSYRASIKHYNIDDAINYINSILNKDHRHFVIKNKQNILNTLIRIKKSKHTNQNKGKS